MEPSSVTSHDERADSSDFGNQVPLHHVAESGLFKFSEPSSVTSHGKRADSLDFGNQVPLHHVAESGLLVIEFFQVSGVPRVFQFSAVAVPNSVGSDPRNRDNLVGAVPCCPQLSLDGLSFSGENLLEKDRKSTRLNSSHRL